MSNSTKTQAARASRSALPPTMMLALWRLRQAGGLLVVSGAGILAAVLLVCIVPLYAQIVMTAGVRSILNQQPENADIVARATTNKISPPIINRVTQRLNRTLQQDLGQYLSTPQFSIDAPGMQINAIIDVKGISHPQIDNAAMIMSGESMASAASHARLLQGRLPRDTGDTLEIAVPPETAGLLHVQPGSVLTMSFPWRNGYQQSVIRKLQAHVVGIFRLASTDDVFWHGNNFQQYQPNDFLTIYRALASNQAILSTLSKISSDKSLDNYIIASPGTLNWFYPLNTSHITAQELPNVVTGINNAKVDNANDSDLEQSPYISQLQTYLPSNVFDTYRQKIEVAQLTVMLLSILIAGMVLFFVSLIGDILVDQQTNAIAVLRSRGASSRQVFGSLLTQSAGLGLIALIAGPLLAVPITRLLVQNTLPPADQGALNLIAGNPLPIALGLSGYAAIAAGAAIVAMALSVVRTLHLDVLHVRREAARATRPPLWQRLNLDIIIAIIALTGYGVSLYVTGAGILDQRSALLLISPLTLVGTLSLLLAALLLFLRFFPRLLQSSSIFTVRSRGAPPLLAIAQMARVPRQPLRMILQLSLAIAFAIFTLVSIATQAQRIDDIATFQTAADFRGTLQSDAITATQFTTLADKYRRIPGVTAASLGYVKPASAGTSPQTIDIDFQAVDADTYGRTATWTTEDSSKPVDALMRQLAAQRNSAITRNVVPAIVDSNAWNALHLSPGANFTLSFASLNFNSIINFVVVDRVEHIPTPDSSIGFGVLADYQTFAAIYKSKIGGGTTFSLPPSTVWLRTADDAASLSSVRTALTQTSLGLSDILDRRATSAALHHEPLYLTLIGVLALGAAIALIFALIGNLIASWLSIRTRLTSFTVLRALGAEPKQVVSTLTWEQCIIYITSIILGMLTGGIFSALVVPVLTFTSVTSSTTGKTSNISNGAFYIAQSVPPIRVIIPPSLVIALAVLAVLCVVALIMMVSVVLRSSMSQTLRINED